MDLGAYMQVDYLCDCVTRFYGEVPRLRGIRFMRVEEPVDADGYWQLEEFNRLCGHDVVCIHTRCGGGLDEDDPCSNYVSCGGRDWEESNDGLFIRSFDDAWDATYRDHYFRAVVDDEYLGLVKQLENALETEGSS